MFKRRPHIKGIAIIEYLFLVLIIIATLIVMKHFITSSFGGHWKASGDSFGFGRRYDPVRTGECLYTQVRANFGYWYDANCYQEQVQSCTAGDLDCENGKMDSCKTTFCCEHNVEAAGQSNCN